MESTIATILINLAILLVGIGIGEFIASLKWSKFTDEIVEEWSELCKKQNDDWQKQCDHINDTWCNMCNEMNKKGKKNNEKLS